MSTEHTRGRVFLAPSNVIGCGDPQKWERLKINSPWVEDAWEGDAEAVANMRRLVACWNACEGIDTEYLEGDESLPHYARRLMTQRDELLASLEKIAGFTLSQFMGPHDIALECVTVACDAIAKVKGGAA